MLISFSRTVILYSAALLTVRIMGKRQIGQLQPFELVVAFIIADLVAIPMHDKDVPLVDGLVPLGTLLLLQYLVSIAVMKNQKLRAAISGTPSILVANGQIQEHELRKLRYNLNDLLEQLRVAGWGNILDVEFAILEPDGELSVIPKSQKRPVNPSDLNLDTEYEGLPLPLIVDGRVNQKNLRKAGLDTGWLNNELQKHGINRPQDALFVSLATNGELYVQKKGTHRTSSPRSKPRTR